jgi:glycine/D-amino acid oxidase-like deaminating enzyme
VPIRTTSAEIVICGAGMAGVAAAYHLAARRGVRGVVLVDAGEPLALTSSRGTEAYRTWWPGPDGAMVDLTARSLDLLEELAAESAGAFALNRRGYAFLTADPERAAALARAAEQVEGLGGGPLRRHPGPEPYLPFPAEGFAGVPGGADLIADPAAIRRLLPGVAPDAIALLHVRRAGWLDARALGRSLLSRAEAAGVERRRDRVTGVEVAGGRVRSVNLAGGGAIAAGALVLAPGPGLAAAGRLLGLELPVVNEAHFKLTLDDRLGAVPRGAPLLVWHDPVRLEWSPDERRRLAADPATRPLLGKLPSGVHCRPRGDGREALVLWPYGQVEDTAGGGEGEPGASGRAGGRPGTRSADAAGAGEGAARGHPDTAAEPAWASFPRFHPLFAEVVLRGLARMLPAAAGYRGRAAAAGQVDGGWYCKAPDNRPLVGPLPVEGAWVLGALSGFGVMASQGAADLLAAHLTGAALPRWAAAFHPGRFEDPEYRRRLAAWDPAAAEL